MDLKRYENQICNVDIGLLKKDEYTFYVLTKILEEECTLTITDKKRIIICYSHSPYPVWIWLPDDATDDELELAYQTVKSNFGIDGKHRFNLKYNHADYFMKRALADGREMKIALNLFAYRCENPISPKKISLGKSVLATIQDLDLGVRYMDLFQKELGMDELNMEEYFKKIKMLIEGKRLFFWQDENGEKVAMTGYSISGDKGSINTVYTRQDKRRMGYGANLVYCVTGEVKKHGKIPVLYTDADYSASNGCYEGIGYVKQGSLCTIK